MSLPGHILSRDPQSDYFRKLAAEWGATCSCGKLATYMVQGETDSFGFEVNPCCDEHKTPEPMTGTCDWCKKHVDEAGAPLVLSPKRDPDEGSHGPVYYVCSPCRQKHDKALHDEAAKYEEEREPLFARTARYDVERKLGLRW